MSPAPKTLEPLRVSSSSASSICERPAALASAAPPRARAGSRRRKPARLLPRGAPDGAVGGDDPDLLAQRCSAARRSIRESAGWANRTSSGPKDRVLPDAVEDDDAARSSRARRSRRAGRRAPPFTEGPRVEDVVAVEEVEHLPANDAVASATSSAIPASSRHSGAQAERARDRADEKRPCERSPGRRSSSQRRPRFPAPRRRRRARRLRRASARPPRCPPRRARSPASATGIGWSHGGEREPGAARERSAGQQNAVAHAGVEALAERAARDHGGREEARAEPAHGRRSRRARLRGRARSSSRCRSRR